MSDSLLTIGKGGAIRDVLRFLPCKYKDDGSLTIRVEYGPATRIGSGGRLSLHISAADVRTLQEELAAESCQSQQGRGQVPMQYDQGRLKPHRRD